MRPDVLLTWPTNCDYPLWRRWLASERARFAQVLVAFSPHPGRYDYRDFVRGALADQFVTFLDTPWRGGEDWRDVAVNAMLDLSDTEWVWFTEQDLRIVDYRFWRAVQVGADSGAALLGIQRDTRWHPCCLFSRRDAVEQTSRYFGSEPVDHFYKFGRELEQWGSFDLERWAPEGSLRHMAGLSRNHQLLDEERYPEVYKPDELAPYLRACLSDGSCEPGWARQAESFLVWYTGGQEDG